MYTLRKIKRKDLDIEKYSKTLNDSINYRIYAEHWYLDMLTDEKWECWIYGDYEVIMPVPLQFKFGFKFVLQPIYCQQLGIFYKEEIEDGLFKEFEYKLHKYRVRSYCFNEENTERYSPKGERKVNYVLDLNKSYDEVFNNYSKQRRKDVRKADKLKVEIRETIDYKIFINITSVNYLHLSGFINDHFLKKYITELLAKEKINICNVADETGSFIASQLFLISGNRRICIGFARDKKKERHNSSAAVKDYLIKKLAGNDILLDFEGSMNPGIADFMKGFGAKEEFYICFSNFSY